MVAHTFLLARPNTKVLGRAPVSPIAVARVQKPKVPPCRNCRSSPQCGQSSVAPSQGAAVRACHSPRTSKIHARKLKTAHRRIRTCPGPLASKKAYAEDGKNLPPRRDETAQKIPSRGFTSAVETPIIFRVPSGRAGLSSMVVRYKNLWAKSKANNYPFLTDLGLQRALIR